jgi:hypothetical protein
MKASARAMAAALAQLPCCFRIRIAAVGDFARRRILFGGFVATAVLLTIFTRILAVRLRW